MARTKDEVIRIAREYGAVVSSVFEDVQVRLFGSYHSGKANEHSDIDLAIVSSDFEDMDYFLSLKILNRFKIKICDEIEPVSMTPKDLVAPEIGSIESAIVKNSERVY